MLGAKHVAEKGEMLAREERSNSQLLQQPHERGRLAEDPQYDSPVQLEDAETRHELGIGSHLRGLMLKLNNGVCCTPFAHSGRLPPCSRPFKTFMPPSS